MCFQVSSWKKAFGVVELIVAYHTMSFPVRVSVVASLLEVPHLSFREPTKRLDKCQSSVLWVTRITHYHQYSLKYDQELVQSNFKKNDCT